MTNGNALAIGTAVRLTKAIGGWPAGARGRVIPCPLKTIPYSEVNTTGTRVEFNEEAAKSIWVVMINEFGLKDLAKFAVGMDEVEVATK